MCFFIFHILSTPGWLYICVYIYILCIHTYSSDVMVTSDQWLIWCFRYVQICFFKCIKDKVGYPKYLILKYLPAIKHGRWHLDPNSHQRTRNIFLGPTLPKLLKVRWWGSFRSPVHDISPGLASKASWQPGKRWWNMSWKPVVAKWYYVVVPQLVC